VLFLPTDYSSFRPLDENDDTSQPAPPPPFFFTITLLPPPAAAAPLFRHRHVESVFFWIVICTSRWRWRPQAKTQPPHRHRIFTAICDAPDAPRMICLEKNEKKPAKPCVYTTGPSETPFSLSTLLVLFFYLSPSLFLLFAPVPLIRPL